MFFMNIEQLQEYCISKNKTTAEFPFDEHTLVFKVLEKIFALVSLQKWEAGEKGINLKCDPDYAEELRAEYNAIKPGHHMNKKHWNTIDLTLDEISPKFLAELIDHSYDMVVKGMSRKMQSNLRDL